MNLYGPLLAQDSGYSGVVSLHQTQTPPVLSLQARFKHLVPVASQPKHRACRRGKLWDVCCARTARLEAMQGCPCTTTPELLSPAEQRGCCSLLLL